MAESPGETKLDSDKELLSSWTVVHRDGHTDSSREPTPVERHDCGSDIEILHEEGDVFDLNVTEERKIIEKNGTSDILGTDAADNNNQSGSPETLGDSDQQLVAHVDKGISTADKEQDAISDYSVDEDVFSDGYEEDDDDGIFEYENLPTEDVPVDENFVPHNQLFVETSRHYIHVRNRKLNIQLNLLVCVAMLFVIAFGLGHYLGWSSRVSYQSYIKDIEEELHRCHADDEQTATEYQTRIDQLLQENEEFRQNLTLLVQQGMDFRDYREELNLLQNENADLKETVAKLRYMSKGFTETQTSSHQLRDLQVSRMSELERNQMALKEEQLLEYIRKNLIPGNREEYSMYIPEAPRFVDSVSTRESVDEYIRKNLNLGRKKIDGEILAAEHGTKIDVLKARVNKRTAWEDEHTIVVRDRTSGEGEFTKVVTDSAVKEDEPTSVVGEVAAREAELIKVVDESSPKPSEFTADDATVGTFYNSEEDMNTYFFTMAPNLDSQDQHSKEQPILRDKNQGRIESALGSRDSTLGAKQNRNVFTERNDVFHKEQIDLESPFRHMEGRVSNAPDPLEQKTDSSHNGKKRDSMEKVSLGDAFESNAQKELVNIEEYEEQEIKTVELEIDRSSTLYNLPDIDISRPTNKETKNRNFGRWKKIQKETSYDYERIQVVDDDDPQWDIKQHQFSERLQTKIWKKQKQHNDMKKPKKKESGDERREDLNPEFVMPPKLPSGDRKVLNQDRKFKKVPNVDDDRVFIGPVNKKRKERKDNKSRQEQKHKTNKRNKKYEETEMKKRIDTLQDQLKKQEDKMNEILKLLEKGKNREETMANTLTNTLAKVGSLIGNLTNSSLLRTENIAESAENMFVNFQSMYEDISLPDGLKNKLKDAKDTLQESIVNVGTQIRNFLKNPDAKDIPEEVGNVFKNTVYKVTKLGKNMLKNAQSPAKAAVKNVVTLVEDWKETLQSRWAKLQETFESPVEKSDTSEDKYDSGYEDDLNDIEQDLQEEKRWEGVFVDTNNDTQDGDWVFERPTGDKEKEKNSDWIFKRGEQRQKKRDEEKKSDWMFERAQGRKTARNTEDRYSGSHDYNEHEEKGRKRKGEKKFDDSFERKRGEYIEDHDDEDDDHDDDDDDEEEAYEKYASPHHREGRRRSNPRRSRKTQGKRGYYHHHQTEEDEDDERLHYGSSSHDEWFAPEKYFQKVQEYLDALARMYE